MVGMLHRGPLVTPPFHDGLGRLCKFLWVFGVHLTSFVIFTPVAAARVNGLAQFLEALKIGIVVRRHWPKKRSVFVQLFSDDGGDSIQ